MQLAQSRKSRLARAITAMLSGQDLNQNLGYEIPYVGTGKHIFRFRTKTQRVFTVEIRVGVKEEAPDVDKLAPYELPDTAVKFVKDMVKPYYFADVQFTDPGGSYGETGKGEFGQVFNKVGAILNQFVKANPHVAAFTFSADPASRVRFYKRLAKKLSGDYGYGVEVTGEGEGQSASFMVPNGAYNTEHAQTALEDAPGGPTYHGLAENAEERALRVEPEPEGEDEPEESEEDRELREEAERDAQYEVAMEQRETDRDYARDQFINETYDEAYNQQENYEAENKTQQYEDYVEELTRPILEQAMVQMQGQRLITDDPDLEAGIIEGIERQAQVQATDQAGEHWGQYWEDHLDDMSDEFERMALQSNEDQWDEWGEANWDENNPEEQYLDY